MFCAGIVNGQKSPISSMKRAIFDDFGDLKGIIGGKRGKEWRNHRKTFPKAYPKEKTPARIP